MDRRLFTKFTTASMASGLMLPQIARAQSKLPNVVKIIVPFSPGGSNDVFARALADQLSQELKISFIVENKPGAGGSMGAAQVAKAAPNGATLLLTSNSIVTNNAVMAKPAFDPVNSFKHVSILNKGPSLVIVHGKSKHNNLETFFAAIQSGEIQNYGSAGVGSSAHMATEMLNYGLKTNLLHVPYKGISNVAVDIAGNNVHMVITTAASVSGQLKTGYLKPIGVTSLAPSAFFKDLKPVSEHIKNYDMESWWGVFAPAETPQWMAELLNQKINEVSMKKTMVDLFRNESTMPVTLGLDQIKNFVQLEKDKYIAIAKSRNIKPI